MKDIIIYILLGAIQGITEPIPVSSSGHLVIFQSIFEKLGLLTPKAAELLGKSDITFEVIVNTGSLIAIMFYYRKDIMRLLTGAWNFCFNSKKRDSTKREIKYIILLVIATIPAAIGGVLFEDAIGSAFSSAKLVGIALLVTATFLMTIHTMGYKGKRKEKDLTLFDAIRMGLFQLAALIPGLSRSGSTITGGLIGGLDQKTARDFSFFMFMPVSLGAIVLKLPDFFRSTTLSTLWLPYLLAFLVSIVTTYFALILLFKILNKNKLNYFAIYCTIVGVLTLLFL